jgi:carboxypeptidase C (cathepsin A)
MRNTILRTALIVLIAAPVAARPFDGARGGRGQNPNQQQAAQPGGRESAGPAEEKTSRTPHTITLDGREIKYTATAGTLPIRGDDGRVQARMFYVAYTKDGEDPKTRPVSFLYNGGPGSATVWLHMGSFAPRHVQMAEDGFQPAPPYHLVDNESSLVDVSDLVFVDAISTGYSRTVEGVNPAPFHGQQGDLRAFGDFIDEYLKTYSRWASPKYLIGESYGTIRSAGLSQELQSRHGIELNGIVLISALLSYQVISTGPQNDLAYVSYFPTYATTAWYHKRLAPDLQAKPVKQIAQDALAFATGEYATTLLRGNSVSDAERKAMAAKIARLTGLSQAYVEQTNLRIDPGRFRKELLRDKRLVVGRLDTRYTAMDLDAAGEQEEFDPSNTALQGAYTAMFMDYVRSDLKWESDLHYDTSGNVRPWTYVQNGYMDMTEPLRSAMAKNPFLRVRVEAGYYDMACVFGGAMINFWHLAYDKVFTDRVSFGWFEGGHMMYTRPSAHKALKADIAKFIAETRSARPNAVQH